MFPPDAPRSSIVATLKTEIEHLGKHGLVDITSPFMREATGILQSLERGEHAKQKRLETQAGTSVERAVGAVIRLSLDVAVAP